jgi:hypothetical protein
MVESDDYQSLSNYQRRVRHIEAAWPQFLSARDDRLAHAAAAAGRMPPQAVNPAPRVSGVGACAGAVAAKTLERKI